MQRLALALIVAAVVAAGCSSSSSGGGGVVVTPSSVIVVDGADAVAWEGGLIWVAAVPIDPSLRLDVTTDATSAAAAFTPPGCATTTVSADMAGLQLTSCSGPFGINRASGVVAYTLSELPDDGAQIVVNAANLPIGGGLLTINATGVLSASGNARTLTVTSNGAGVGPNGASLEREGQYTISWNAGDRCATVNGNVSADGLNIETTMFSNFVVCTTGCPRSGTVTANEPATGETFTTTYDGSASVTVTEGNGTQTVTALSCG